MVFFQVGAARFESVTVRAFKLPELEDRCEDYGQVRRVTLGRRSVRGRGRVLLSK